MHPIGKRGPNTAKGKRAVSRNAVRHGILSADPVPKYFEEKRDWQRHLRGMMESCEPQGHHETVIVERIAAILWRLNRLVRWETEMIEANWDKIEDDIKESAEILRIYKKNPREEITPRHVDRELISRMVPESQALEKIIRYEAHLHRQYIQLLHELEALQSARHGQRLPLARLDIATPPA